MTPDTIFFEDGGNEISIDVNKYMNLESWNL